MQTKELSLLFVEDDKEIQENLLSFLQKLPFSNIYVASDGKAGLEQFHLHKPDIVLTDLRMPFMSGLELAAAIKRSDSNTPIILITSKFEKEVTEDALDIGVEAYLFKPITPQRLTKVLHTIQERVLEKRAFLSEHKLFEEYKNALDVSASVTKTDKYGRITYVNDAFCKMSGYTQEELLGNRHSLVRHPQTPDSFYENLWRTIEGKKVYKGKVQNLKKDRSSYVEQLVIVPIVDDGGVIVEFIAIHHDVTDLHNQELFLQRRVQEEVERNLLETKYSAIGRMAAGITHEINTPLTYVKGNVELMFEDIASLDESIMQKRYLEEDARVIADGVNRIANIVESMREMASQSKLKSEPTNIYASLITALIISYNKSKHVSKVLIQNTPFLLSMPKERFEFMALAQKQRIEQVWIIIINNAIDALKHKEHYEDRLLEITIESEHQFIVVRFKDNGGGIDAKVLPKIFDPFESTKEEGGMGIGLNVAHRIVNDHHGEIRASNYEDGALFEVYLPRC